MQEEKFTVEKTSRVFSLGKAGPHIKKLIIALHGYGQLPAFFLRKFTDLENAERRIVAPEGLHRFYLDGTSGRVGASWMTKEARLDDIADQAAHLDAVLARELEKNPNVEHVTLVGFSQGVSAACRWVDHRAGKSIDHLICWAGSFPPDIDYALKKEAFTNLRFDTAFGDTDEFAPEHKIQEVLGQLAEFDIVPKLHRYSGGHSIEPALLKEIIDHEN
ncbi:alpha/beta hydrolase [Phaeocystidibacter luteus]|uniref:alpha/beta hydrolase n=1 Tax=Phaeocystidibacter luteus TaxID=911197 RepID=UPI0014792376|nr:phospholipase [Phaeocystidibacter luteus]